MPRLAVIIVTWNSRRYLPHALKSLNEQTWRDFAVVVVDNASTDGTVEYIREACPTAMVLRNTQNRGFARANNQGLAYARAQLVKDREDFLVLLMNDDTVLAPDYLERMVAGVERRSDVGSATGLVCKARWVGEEDERDLELTDVVDTTGLLVTKARRFYERGTGSAEAPQRFGRTQEVFGVSGCLALYRWGALRQAELGGQWLDEDYFMYKEDLDLAWRLRLLGWKSLYLPEARAWHFRTAAGGERQTILGEIIGRRRRSTMVQAKSFRNHLLTLVKNEQPYNLMLDWPRILLHETLQAGYLTLFRPQALVLGTVEFFRLLPQAMRKRRQIMAGARVGSKEMRQWFL
jgi:GT2 family glycosyltransferase